MDRTNYYAPMTRALVDSGVFAEREFVIFDVGMRGGGHSVWNSLAKAADVIGFEPDPEESDRINAQSRMFHQRCHPIALGSVNGERSFNVSGQLASAGFHPPSGKWLAHRFYVEPFYEKDGSPKNYRDYIAAARIDPHLKVDRQVQVKTVTLDSFAAEAGITNIDFLKIDVEGSELDVLQGATKMLPFIQGIEVEVNFVPHRIVPLFHDISAELTRHGFELYDLDMHRMSRGALPSDVAGDWRDHAGGLALGPSVSGQPVTGDGLFFRNPVLHEDHDVRKALRLACLFEMFGLPDCAAEILRYFEAELASMIDVPASLQLLLPPGTTLREYIRGYLERVGRPVPKPAVIDVPPPPRLSPSPVIQRARRLLGRVRRRLARLSS